MGPSSSARERRARLWACDRETRACGPGFAAGRLRLAGFLNCRVNHLAPRRAPRAVGDFPDAEFVGDRSGGWSSIGGIALVAAEAFPHFSSPPRHLERAAWRTQARACFSPDPPKKGCHILPIGAVNDQPAVVADRYRSDAPQASGYVREGDRGRRPRARLRFGDQKIWEKRSGIELGVRRTGASVLALSPVRWRGCPGVF
jgi:hypothetical protein